MSRYTQREQDVADLLDRVESGSGVISDFTVDDILRYLIRATDLEEVTMCLEFIRAEQESAPTDPERLSW